MFKVLKKRWYIVLGILALIGFFSYRTVSVRQSVEKKDPLTITKQDIREEISLSGTITARDSVVVRFQSGGMITWIGIKEGDYVAKGQAIASLDQRELSKRFQKYLNTYVKTRQIFDQTKDENEEIQAYGLTQEQRDEAKRLIDESQQDLNNSVLDVEIGQLTQSYSTIYAPISGTMIRVDAPYPGVNIIPTQAEFEIANLDTMYFGASADQADVVKLYEGQEGEIVLDAYPDSASYGVIERISYTPITDETGTSYEVKVDLGQSSTGFRLGMTGDITFRLKERLDVIAVPPNYIETENGDKYVLKDEKGKVVKTEVKTGTEIEDLVEITSGLQVGDIIYDQN